jgi:hypothetical protein
MHAKTPVGSQSRTSSTVPCLASTTTRRAKYELKSWSEFFEPILLGKKTHDLRRADDRNFEVGDVLLLREFNPQSSTYTGRELLVEVTYITSAKHPCALSEASLHRDFCILSIRKL